jgi:hypothetical protein
LCWFNRSGWGSANRKGLTLLLNPSKPKISKDKDFSWWGSVTFHDAMSKANAPAVCLALFQCETSWNARPEKWPVASQVNGVPWPRRRRRWRDGCHYGAMQNGALRAVGTEGTSDAVLAPWLYHRPF